MKPKISSGDHLIIADVITQSVIPEVGFEPIHIRRVDVNLLIVKHHIPLEVWYKLIIHNKEMQLAVPVDIYQAAENSARPKLTTGVELIGDGSEEV